MSCSEPGERSQEHVPELIHEKLLKGWERDSYPGSVCFHSPFVSVPSALTSYSSGDHLEALAGRRSSTEKRLVSVTLYAYWCLPLNKSQV